jgi:hypothetical protein
MRNLVSGMEGAKKDNVNILSLSRRFVIDLTSGFRSSHRVVVGLEDEDG